MTRIQRSIDIPRPPEQVFETLTDLERLPLWATTVVENHDTPGRPLQQGDRFSQTIHLVGRNLRSDWEVRSIEPPNHVEYEATSEQGGSLRMVQRVAQTPEGSRVELELDYELPGGFLGEALNRVYVERRNEREAEHSLQNLKELVERTG